MKNVPPISRFMFAAPLVIDREATVEEAKEKMERYGIRHLPVIKDEKVVGLVSSRDIDLASSLEQRIGTLKVGTITNNHVFAVDANTPTDQVLWEMANYKYGSAVVIDKTGKAIGIFTSIDALKLLGTLLQEESSGIDLSQCDWPTP